MRWSTDRVLKQTIEQITQPVQFSAQMAVGNEKCRDGDDDDGACDESDAHEGTGDDANHVCDTGEDDGESYEQCS